MNTETKEPDENEYNMKLLFEIKQKVWECNFIPNDRNKAIMDLVNDEIDLLQGEIDYIKSIS